MGKKPLAITAAILLVIVSGILFLSLESDKSAMEQMRSEKTNNDSSISSGEDGQQAMAAAGTYIEYTPTAIANTKGTKILFFHAPWCPQCRALEADIKQRGVPSGMTIIKVDYDSSQSLRQQYGVTLQTTLVRIDDQGKLQEKFVAYDDPSVKAIEENLL